MTVETRSLGIDRSWSRTIGFPPSSASRTLGPEIGAKSVGWEPRASPPEVQPALGFCDWNRSREIACSRFSPLPPRLLISAPTDEPSTGFLGNCRYRRLAGCGAGCHGTPTAA